MLDISFPKAYKAGLIQVDQDVVHRYGLDATTSELLLRIGLPLKLPEDSALVQFRSPEIIRVHDADALVIGSEPWEEDLWISLSPTGEVLAVGDGGPKRVNRGFLDFLGFLEAYVEF